jgi:hypothetical protein
MKKKLSIDKCKFININKCDLSKSISRIKKIMIIFKLKNK